MGSRQQSEPAEPAVTNTAEFAETRPPGWGIRPLTQDGGAKAQDTGRLDRDQDRVDSKSADRIARDAGMATQSRRPWMLALLAILVVVGVSALAGWQTRWPEAVFGVQKTAVTTPASPAQAPAQVQASTPDSFTPSATDSSPASGDASDPDSVVNAYFAAINSQDYTTAWALGGKNTGSSYSEFVAGLSTTSNDDVTIVSTSGDVVTAQLVAQQNDGSTKTFQGTYTVSGEVITSFDVQQTG